MDFFRSQDEEIALNAIKHAVKALRKRHLLEESAHAPALIALYKPLAYQVLPPPSVCIYAYVYVCMYV